MADYYTVLGLPYDATPEEIRAVYFELARKYHPDVSEASDAKEKFILIQEAYDVLSAPQRRAVYDQKIPIELRRGPEITVNLKYSRNTVPIISGQQLFYVLVDLICSAQEDVNQLPPFHLCLVLDKSTSMQGTRMDMVKAAAGQLIRQFRPQDMLSVVTFSDRADVLIPPTRASEVREDHRINLIQPSGGTEIYQGLALGVQQLRSLDDRYLRQLILLTDGHTYGDDDACIELVETISKEGISLSAMGIGHEWNDQLLDRISSLSGGNAILVSSPKDLNKFMEQKLGMLGNTYARNMVFDYVSDQGVQLRYAFRLNPETGPIPVSASVPLGTLMYHKSMSFLLEFVLPPIAPLANQIKVASGDIKLDIPVAKGAHFRIKLDISVPSKVNPESEPPPSQLVEAMAKLTLYRMQEKIRKEVAEGQVDRATRHLHFLATHLLSQGDRELAHTVLVEAEHIQQSRRFSKEGDKRIKYGTRALLLPSGSEQKS